MRRRLKAPTVGKKVPKALATLVGQALLKQMSSFYAFLLASNTTFGA